ncbi:hypothetical protein ACFC18_21365 [Streptomyces sp. NPDC056121]|uniref:hypothetical protein n=1 Tax=Streptomyces TaxID=1883 RepID=UPI001D0A81BE|nr:MULTISPECIES: hypothetical protein [Streptomyces]MCX5087154.1 hypothetical protein [Streptomyces sp. NBC_00401]UDM05172.1 hypothetical protein LGI35_28155 [Streptomyces longhuiensis]
MMGDGAKDLGVDHFTVQRLTQGIGDAIGELKEIGTSTGGVLGKGFSEMAMTGMEAGHHGLSVDFEDFCERWEWGVRALIQDANTIAAKLGLAAGVLWEEDRYVESALKYGVNSLAGGSPYASEEDIAKQDWGDVFTPDALNPDWSAESWDRAGDEMGQTWKDTGRALVTEGQGGEQSRRLNELFGIDQEQFDKAVDDTFGPSPEERAQQQQQQNEAGGN